MNITVLFGQSVFKYWFVHCFKNFCMLDCLSKKQALLSYVWIDMTFLIFHCLFLCLKNKQIHSCPRCLNWLSLRHFWFIVWSLLKGCIRTQQKVRLKYSMWCLWRQLFSFVQLEKLKGMFKICFKLLCSGMIRCLCLLV